MQIKHLKKYTFTLLLLLSITAHSQNQYNVLREEAVHYMNLNDANQAIQSLTKIVQLYKKSPESILDIFYGEPSCMCQHPISSKLKKI